MDAEIELKLFFLPENKNNLINEINHLFSGDFQSDVVLSNGYFDTEDLQLRHWDMGLRVRGRNGEREQTIKTAGKVVGGIHSRPEYNVAIDADTPELSLFPAAIWPEGADLGATQARLGCVFHTDFRRLTWHVTEGESRIEIALDEGTISSGNKSEPLCELEFELLSGVPADLLSLADKLVAKVPMRLGKASKAQRGYRLAGLGGKRALEVLEGVPLAGVSDAGAGFALIIETALERWQLLEDLLAQSSGDPLGAAPLWARLRTAVMLLDAACRQFGVMTDTLAAGFSEILAQLDFIDEAQALALIAENRDELLGRRPDSKRWQDDAAHRLKSDDLLARLERLWRLPAYGQVQLAMVSLLFKKPQAEGQIATSASSSMAAPTMAASTMPASTIATIAAQRLQQCLDELVAIERAAASNSTIELSAELLSPALRDAGAELESMRLADITFGELYEPAARRHYRAAWQDAKQRFDVLGAYQLLGKLAGPDAEMHDWLDDKGVTLNFGARQSLAALLALKPYWHLSAIGT
ncbi:CYTH domain-containing protein [Shewanella sp. JM162201]|uniref:CYTH domain-containing protein n=1 Tax=Shewanella jiangmenensis TaxID=2837387 RepID=A0ABS5V411_9GAMM|nr:CYTH domain-containing protein [Shewanella jiangmenensis]MBT1444551.1 CYTH domain-containing protein [Shewanella jiangmenensis]